MDATKKKYLRSGISISAGVLIVIHILWPSLAIDGTLAFLFAIAIIPWLYPLFKSIEIPGVGKVEFADEIKRVADEVKLKIPQQELRRSYVHPELSFLVNPDENPNLVLAWLRIEIETMLRKLANREKVTTKKESIREMLNALTDAHVLPREIAYKLADLVGTLNKGVHGINISEMEGRWAMEQGLELLNLLKHYLSMIEKEKARINERNRMANIISRK